MTGNAWQWAADRFPSDQFKRVAAAGKAEVAPQGPSDSWDPSEPGIPARAPRRVIRGGSFLCNQDYWIERPGTATPEAAHVVQSWDYERLVGELLGKGLAKIGEKRPAARSWTVYGGEVIPLKPGEILHVNAMRIGYSAVLTDYADGKVLP